MSLFWFRLGHVPLSCSAPPPCQHGPNRLYLVFNKGLFFTCFSSMGKINQTHSHQLPCYTLLCSSVSRDGGTWKFHSLWFDTTSYRSIWWLCPLAVCGCPDLWVLVNLLGVLLVTVDVEPDGGSGAACAAETENNSGAIGKDDPEALREKHGRMKKKTNKTVTVKHGVEQNHDRSLISNDGQLLLLFISKICHQLKPSFQSTQLPNSQFQHWNNPVQTFKAVMNFQEPAWPPWVVHSFSLTWFLDTLPSTGSV